MPAALTAIATICGMGALVWFAVEVEVAGRGNSAGTEQGPTGDTGHADTDIDVRTHRGEAPTP